MTRALLLTVMLSIAATPPAALGHAIVVYSGRLALQSNTLRLSIDLHERLLEHERRALGRGATPQRLAELLAESIVVFTDEGEQLTCTGVAVQDNPQVVDIVFDVPAGVSALALLHMPNGLLAAQSRQFQLRRIGSSPDRSELVRLTSGGNHQVVRTDETDLAQTLGVNEFAEPILRVLPAGDGKRSRIEVDFPCSLLDAWPDLDLGGRVVANHMLRERGAALNHWFDANLECANADGEVAWHLSRLTLIAPDGQALGDLDSDSGCLFTTRVRFSVALDPAREVGPIHIVWRGFHQAMMRMAVVVTGDDRALRLADLTPTQNVLRVDGVDVVRAMDRVNAQRASDKRSAKSGSKG